MQDPFYVVKEEVTDSVRVVSALFDRWSELSQNLDASNQDEFEWTNSELEKRLKSIEVDLQDLDETISIVETSRTRFRLDDDEITGRRRFVEQTKQTVNNIKDKTRNPAVLAKLNKNKRQALLAGNGHSDQYSHLDNEIEKDNQSFIDDKMREQQRIRDMHDAQLGQVSIGIGRITEIGKDINSALDQDIKLLHGVEDEADNTLGRFKAIQKRLDKFIKENGDGKTLGIIICLIVLCVILVVLLFTLG